MIRMLLCGVLGLAIGALLGGGLGSVMGLICGVALGYAWTGAQDVSTPPEEGAAVERERECVLCIPRGRPADCVFVRDPHTRRWLDVESCSLAQPNTEVNCEKRCLVLMNDAAGLA